MSDKITLEDFERFCQELPASYDQREAIFLNSIQKELAKCMDMCETEEAKKACFRGFLMAMRELEL